MPTRDRNAAIEVVSLPHVLVLVSAVVILSYLAARLGGLLVLRPEMIWPLWPGCAFLVAVLLLTPRRIWPALLMAGLVGFALYDAQVHLPIRAIGWLLLADSIEVLIAALGVSYLFAGVPYINSVKALAKYSLFAVILAPIAVASLAAKAFQTDSWRVAVLTEALALLTLTPAILSWADIALCRLKAPKTQYIEAASICLGLLTTGYFAFAAPASQGRPASLYLLVPFLLWAALRFGITGASNSSVLVSFVAIWGAVHKHGPFTGDTAVNNMLSLQLFLLVAGTSFMVLAAVVEGHKAAEQLVRESEERLRLAAQLGRMFAYSWDATTDAVERTGQSEDILGVKEEVIATGTAVSAMVHPDDRERLDAALENLTVENPTLQITYRILRPDGVVKWLQRNSHAYFDGNGNLSRMIGMVVDVTERKMSEQTLADMSRKLIQAQEQERTRIGRELHDDINHRLAMLAMGLEQLRNNPPEAESRAEQLRRQTTEISNDVQALSHDLQSSKLEYLGVVAGIKSWCKEYAERQKMKVDCTCGVSSAVPLEIGLGLFRVLQEAVHNAFKHSGVKRIEVQLRENSGEIHLLVRDLGKGFDVEASLHGAGLGLINMRERVRLLNGLIAIESKPMSGTTIHVHVPLASERNSQRAAV